jgi:hypothetical protein
MNNRLAKKLRKIARKEERKFYQRFWEIVGRSPFWKRLWLAWNILWHSQKELIREAYRRGGEDHG